MCEFCGEHNKTDVVSEELPTEADTTFLISPPPTVGGVAGGGVAGIDEALVVFCIDVSGSMCVTTEVREIIIIMPVDQKRLLQIEIW